MPEAPAGVQQDWYTDVAGQSLMYARNAAARAQGDQGPLTAGSAGFSDAYAAALQQRPPYISAGAAGHAAAPAFSLAQVLDPVERSADRLSAAPAEVFTDKDMPLAVGSHPYAARPGSGHRRRVGLYLGLSPGELRPSAEPAPQPTTAAPLCPAPNQGSAVWEEKQTVCFYCKTENWPRRTFCYMCRRDFATGWWHPDDCSCGDC
jgi:hypothetical protein